MNSSVLMPVCPGAVPVFESNGLIDKQRHLLQTKKNNTHTMTFFSPVAQSAFYVHRNDSRLEKNVKFHLKNKKRYSQCMIFIEVLIFSAAAAH